MVWEGSRALGLHPWHPDVMQLSQHQLWWAIVQSREDKGFSPRGRREEARAQERSESVGKLVAWADTHISGS